MEDVMDTLQHVISIEKEMAKNFTFLQKEIGTRNTNNVTVALTVNSFHQTVLLMRRTAEQIIDVSCGNTAALVGIDQFFQPQHSCRRFLFFCGNSSLSSFF